MATEQTPKKPKTISKEKIVTKQTPSKKIKRSDSKARSASAAVFFNDNKSIAGFGNPLRAVFTSIRELVENALDAAEKRNVTPNIFLRLRRMTVEEVSNLMDMDSTRLGNKKLDFLQLTCRDNGVGVPRELIPQLFGTVLAGTKYGAQQTRGRFGLGSKMVLLYSMSTLDLPIQITTRPIGSDVTYRVKLKINLEQNKPIIISDEVIHPEDPDYFEDFGTEVTVSFTGNWGQAKNYVREYFKQLAIITPYADMHIFLPGDEPGTEDELIFKRVVDDLPKPPEVVPVHPWGTDITTFRREIAQADPNDTVVEFLSKNFMGVSLQAAQSFFEEVGVDPTKKPSELTEKDIRRIVHDGFQRAFREAKEVKRKRDRIFKFDEPKGDALSPLGADRLRKGIEKELEPIFVEAVTRPPKAYEGHPFIIEAAIGYGGGVNKATASKGATIIDNKVIYRYANRIPLIFGAGNDVIKHVIDSIKWNEYGLTRQSDPLAIAVSLVSTKIPFPETSKEYIDKVDEIAEEIKLALLQLGRKLKSFLNRSRRKQRERQRRSRFERYAPQTANNLLEILKRANRWDPDVGLKPERLIAALSSGEPRIGRFDLPKGRSIFIEPIWIPEKWKLKLQSNNIFTTEEFLRTENARLAKLLRIKAERIDYYKRKTILIHGTYGNIPSLPIDLLVPPEIERRFHSRDAEVQLPHLSKALPRRWIQTSWDYLVTPPYLLDKVQGLLPKLIEELKLVLLYEIQQYNERLSTNETLISDLESLDFSSAQSLAEETMVGEDELSEEDKVSLQEFLDPSTAKSEIDLNKEEIDLQRLLDPKNLLPDLDQLLKFPEIRKRKVANHIEFLIETTHPSNPINSENIGPDLIQTYLEKLNNIGNETPSVLEVRIDNPQPFFDGYTRNAFKRRKLQTVKDLLSTPSEVVNEIRELQRFLFTHLMETLMGYSTPLDPYTMASETSAKFIPLLQKLGIETLEELANLNSHKMSKHKKIDELRILLFEDSKNRVIDSLMQINEVSPLDEIKVIEPGLEDYINENHLEELFEFLATPIDENEYKEDLQNLKKKYGYKLDLIGKRNAKILNKVGIFTLEEFYYNFDRVYQRIESETDKSLLAELFMLLAESVHLLSDELIPSMNFLIDAGINTIGKFLIWPKDEISRITGLSEEWLELLQEGFNLKQIKKAKAQDPAIETITFLNSSEIEATKFFNILTVGQLVSILWKDRLPDSMAGKKIVKHNLINSALFSPLPEITGFFKDEKLEKVFQQGLKKLQAKGVRNFLQLLTSPKSKISSMVTGKKASEAVNLFLYLIDHPDEKEVNPENLYFRVAQVFNAKRKLDLSLVHLSEFSSSEIDTLGKHGIKRIYQLFLSPTTRIANILGKSKKRIQDKIEKSSLKLRGTPIAVEVSKGKYRGVFEFEVDNVPHFTSNEIQSLIESGYDTIEKLYYLTEVKTFEVYGLTWPVISQMKSLLRSPAVLLSWKEEIPLPEKNPEADEKEQIKQFKYITLEADELKKLSKAKLTRVFDFLTTPAEELSEILGWPIEQTKTRQTTVILQEVGIDLESLNLFRPIQITHLKANDLLTLEDLYFSTFEESWDSYLVPWEAISSIKQLLQLPVKFAEEELGEEIISTLTKSGIQTIIDFLLTGDKILEQKTRLPAERFENLKHALEFSSLVEAYDKTVFFTPNLRYFHAKKLHESGIKSILNLLLTPINKTSKITGLSKPEIKFILDNISRETVAEAEQENGIPLKDINIFRKAEIRSITKSGVFECSDIDTLQELKYQLSSDSFINDPALATLIKHTQMVLDLPLSEFPSVTEEELDLLNGKGILTLADLLFVSEEDLSDDDAELDTLVTRLTNRFIDFRPFVAMAKIPATAISQTPVDGSILENWINSPDKVDKQALRRLPSLLMLELRQSAFAPFIVPPHEDILDEKVAEILIRYSPDHDDWLLPLFEAFNTPGFLIELSQSGNTPITLLDIDPASFRALMNANLATIEELILRDPYELSDKTGLSLKFFRELKDTFSTEKYRILLSSKGIPIEVLPDNELIKSLKENGIEFLDQVIPFVKSSVPEIADLKRFLFSNIIHLTAFPGEMEFAQEQGAENIIEAILVFRQNDLDTSTMKDILHLGWYSWTNCSIPIPFRLDWLDVKDIRTVQDLAMIGAKEMHLPKKLNDFLLPFLESPLFLNLDGRLLAEIVDLYRSQSILHMLSNPLVIPLLPDQLLGELRSGKISLVKEVKIPINILKYLSSSVWRTFESDSGTLTVQQILSSPRGLSSYLGYKQSHLKAAREAFRVPLTQLVHNGQPITPTFNNVWLEDLIYDLPSLYSNKDTRSEAETILKILKSEISISPDILLPKDAMEIVSTALGEKIEGFHKLWAVSWVKAKALMNSQTEFASYTIEVISKSFLPISKIPGIDLSEVWNFWKLDIITIADLLLTPRETIMHPAFSKRRLNELETTAIQFISELDVREDLPSVEITSIKELPLIDPSSVFTLPLLYATTSHPVGKSAPSFHHIHYILTQPIITTSLTEKINLVDLKVLLSKDIVSLIDLLVYPMKDLPETILDYPKRIMMVAENLERIKEDISVELLHPPEAMKEMLNDRGIQTLSEFLSAYATHKIREFAELVFSHIRYSIDDEEKVTELLKKGYSTLFDALLLKSEDLELFGFSSFEEYFAIFDLETINSMITVAPLKISDFEDLSGRGQQKLMENYIISILDLQKVPEGLSKADEKNVATILSILDCPTKILLFDNQFKGYEKEILQIMDNPLRETLKQTSSSKSKFYSDVSKIKFRQLLDITEKFRPLNLIEEIKAPDAKKLNREGIFLYQTILEKPTAVKQILNLPEEKIKSIVSSLSSTIDSIVNLSSEDLQKGKQLGLLTVAEFLDDPRLRDIVPDTPLVIAKQIQLEEIFEEEIASFLKNHGITKMQDLLTQDTKILVSDDQAIFKKLVSRLNATVTRHQSIRDTWASSLRKSGIHRIWQLYQKDETSLQEILGASLKSIREFKESLQLKQNSIDCTSEEAFDQLELLKPLQTIGIYSFDEILPPVYPGTQHLTKEISVLEEIRNIIKSPIWEYEAYWKLDVGKREELAKKIPNPGSVLDATTISAFTDVVHEILISPTKRDPIPLEMFKLQKNDLEAAKNMGIRTLEHWFFEYLRENEEVLNLSSFKKLFRSSILLLKPTPKQTKQLRSLNITHITDLLLNGYENIAKRVRLKNGQISTLPSFDEFKSQLYPIGYFSKTLIEPLQSSDFVDWLQLLGNLVSADLYGKTGLTRNSFSAGSELFEIGIWETTVILDLGLDVARKLVSKGIFTIGDLLLTERSLISECSGIEESKINDFFVQIKKSTINKARKEDVSRLSVSRKIKVSEIPDYEKLGITSVLQIAIGAYKPPRSENQKKALEDVKRILNIPIEAAQLPPKVKKKAVEAGLSTIGKFLFNSDAKLKALTKITPKQIAEFRKNLPYDAKVVSNLSKTSQKATKSKSPAKKTANKKSASSKKKKGGTKKKK